MQVRTLLPDQGLRDLEEILSELTSLVRQFPLRPFDTLVMQFCAELSSRLLSHPKARRRPEIAALAYWMRRSQIKRLHERFQAWNRDDVRWFPRGLVFHLPPSNVDTIFLYSWVPAALAGNRNLLRLSSRCSETVTLLLEVLAEMLARPEYTGLEGLICCVGFGHDPQITAAITERCDLRVVWGGDHTVAELRRIPLPPLARELVFPDRFSFTAIGADEYLEADQEAQERVAEDFWNDAYWFDQMACSSPRLIIWRGSAPAAARASEQFFGRLHQVILARGYSVDTGLALDKISLAHRAALDQPLDSVRCWGNEIMVLNLARLVDIRADRVGGGVFHQFVCADLHEILDFVQRRDQTLTYFGLGHVELEKLVAGLNGRGIDRLVPIGQALQFHDYWDGQDLLHEMLRAVYAPGIARPGVCGHSGAGPGGG